MPPFDYCQHVEDGSKVKCGVHDAPTCERCLKEWAAGLVESKVTELQQLQDEIAALANHLDSVGGCVINGFNYANAMRQLSAV